MTTPSFLDRRRHTRHAVPFPLELEWKKEGGLAQTQASVCDISFGGVYFLTDRPFEPDETLGFRFPFCSPAAGEDEAPLAFTGRVIRTDAHPDVSDLYGIAVAFDYYDAEAAQAIVRSSVSPATPLIN